eukprot:2630892-Prymnesium_polylepis.1
MERRAPSPVPDRRSEMTPGRVVHFEPEAATPDRRESRLGFGPAAMAPDRRESELGFGNGPR